MPGADGRIIRCLVLGDQDAPTQTQRREFRETGTMHFLAISGLHVALLAACCWWTLGAFGVGLRATSVAVFLAALTFALLSGFEHGVQRSVIMCGVWCGAYLLARKMNFPSGMALALILILLIRPADLYSIGLQLSFAAVLGMWLFSRPLEYAIFGSPYDPLNRLGMPEGRSWPDYLRRSRFKSIACATVVVWLATAPLIAQQFGTFTPIAPVASLLLLPLLPVAVAAGLAGALVGLFSAFAAQPLLWLAGGCAHVLEWACRAAAQLPGVCVYLPPPGWAMILLCGAVFTALAYRARLGLTRRRIAGADARPGVRVPAVHLAAVVRPPPACGRDLGRPWQLHPHAVPGRPQPALRRRQRGPRGRHRRARDRPGALVARGATAGPAGAVAWRRGPLQRHGGTRAQDARRRRGGDELFRLFRQPAGAETAPREPLERARPGEPFQRGRPRRRLRGRRGPGALAAADACRN